MNDLELDDCRRAFSQTLLEEGKKNANIVVVATDSMGSSLVSSFASSTPRQFVEAGIAEQNAVGIAAGLGLSGKNVFVCAPASFLSLRSAEQAKVDVAYNRANVKLVGVSAGFSYGALGSTHHALQDIAVMTSLAGMTVLCPCDATQAGAVAQFLCSFNGPAYVRVGRGKSPIIYRNREESFIFGKANVLMHGSDVTLVATGEIVANALYAAELLAAQGIHATVLDFCCIKPFDCETLQNATGGSPVVSIEEHGATGGLGDAVAQVLAPSGIRHLRLCAPDDWLPCSNATGLRHISRLDSAGIACTVANFIARTGTSGQ